MSRCLLGEAVRYDGRDKLDPRVRSLAAVFELLPLCPEVEVGMGVPRPPVELTGRALVDPAGRDWAPEMRAWGRAKLAALAPLDGFVLKRKSPSCGPDRGGVFASLLPAALPVCDESTLGEAFLRAVWVTFSARTGVPITERTVRDLLEGVMIDRKADGT